MTQPSPTAIQTSVDYLGTDAALASIAFEPYWPKWDSPWWHMLLLHEVGAAHRIPARMATAMAHALQTHFLPMFPLSVSELPPGCDPDPPILCHCALGGILQALAAAGVPMDDAFPGARAWFLRYQLPDGGLNCDEAAYTRPTPRSSMVSTLPVLEAMLHGTERAFTAEEVAFLDAGAQYVLQRRLCWSISRGGLIDESWLTPCFPRFYEYDVLRGLRFLTAWARRLSRPLPRPAVEEVVDHLEALFADGTALPRRWAQQEYTLPADGQRPMFPSGSFSLLDEVSRPEVARALLLQEWQAVRTELQLVLA